MKAVLGIIGGGQLGRMLVEASKQLNISTIILDPTKDSPAGKITQQIVGSYKDKKPIKKLASLVEYLTYEIEGANAKALNELLQQGHSVEPNPESLELIQDKLAQKQFLLSNNLPVVQFSSVKNRQDIIKVSKYLGYPLILKARFHGFDGRGNAQINSERNIDKALAKLKGSKLMIEKQIPFKKELAIQVVRNRKGQIKVYPLVETIQKDGICNIVKYPAGSNSKVENAAKRIAKKIITLFKGAGVFAVEMFETKDGKVLVNEIAPRVHNSGHWTIEGSRTSQFENHVRAVVDLPLKSTEPKVKAAVMINILGQRNGKAELNGLRQVEKLRGAQVHIYEKEETKKQRKMGHITVVGSSLPLTYDKALTARKFISI